MKAWWFALGGLAFFCAASLSANAFPHYFFGVSIFGFSAFVLSTDGVLWGRAFFYQKNIGEERA